MPQTKARFAQSIIEELGTLPPATLAAIRARTGPAWDRIVGAMPVEWLEETTYNALTEATRAELGDDAFRALFRRLGRRLMRSPMFQAVMEAVIRISGLSPHTLLKVSPRARDSVVHDSGVLTYVRVDDKCAHLVLRDFPASTYRTGTTSLLLSGTWLGLLDVAGQGATASVTLEDVDLERGRTTFVVRW